MADTLTIDPTPQAEVVDSVDGIALTAEEQDSLQVGEQMQDQQEQLLAGKYKDAQELEKAYVELSKKLGEKSEPDTQEPESETETVDEESTEETVDLSPAAELINSANDEFYSNDGKLSPETINKFSSMSSKDLVEAYMEVQRNAPQEAADAVVADISQQAINEIKNEAGGEDAYSTIIDWASSNLNQNAIDAFDSIVNTGSVDAIKIAISGLKAQYDNANGYEGRMVTGKQAPPKESDTFRSQAELVRAMSDRKYDNDPAYRQDVMAKLDRSKNLEF